MPSGWRKGGPDAHRRNAETQPLGLTYRGSTLARDERDAPTCAQAGDRAPDAPCHDALETPVRLFDIFRGPHFTLLAFGPHHAATVAAVSQRYGAAVRAYAVARPGEPTSNATLVDTEGHANRAYDIDAGTLVLVRPDGYVGLITQHPSAGCVYDYLKHVAPPDKMTR
ncbi:MAG: hypothetical protein ACJ8CR_18150 [Roseiflexaceae bacterium]